MQTREILRIVDANFNRSREGLRVCEEISRFVLQKRGLTQVLKKARHELSDCLITLPNPLSKIIEARDVKKDIGREPSSLEAKRKDWQSLFLANSQRVKESLRVLEETVKLIHPTGWKKIKNLRFKIYAVEKKAMPSLEALRNHGR